MNDAIMGIIVTRTIMLIISMTDDSHCQNFDFCVKAFLIGNLASHAKDPLP